MPKINQEEYEVLKGLDDKWKWVARDKDRGLYAFTEKSVRKYNPSPYWDTKTEEDYSALELFDEIRFFQFIQWEDEEPYSIAELIKEYEFGKILLAMAEEETVLEFESESEGTEVKDIEWLKRSIDKRIKNIESDDITFVGSEYYDEGYIDGMKDALDYISKLDEPEVLSQELPVIPKFVADWYESEGKRSSWWNWLYKWGRDEGRTELETKTIRWMQDFNEEAFVDMFRYGYEVEKEQKYYVLGKHDTPILFRDYKNRITETSNLSGAYPKVDSEDFEFTEQEIKDYDERYWAFAVKVEELEE